MAIADRNGLPIAAWIGSASPNEIRLVDNVLNERFTDGYPVRMIGDTAYDSNKLDRHLKDQFGIEMIAPHHPLHRKTQDGRPLRRYRRRWKVERLFAWLHNFRRLVTRWERRPELYLAFVQLACAMILLRHF
jgi:transposase